MGPLRRLDHGNDNLAIRAVLGFDRRSAFVHEFFDKLVEFSIGTDNGLDQFRHGLKVQSIRPRDDFAIRITRKGNVGQV